MRTRRASKLFDLKKPKLRQSWDIQNLYNIARFRPHIGTHLTFFQQKWAAKAMMRAYHGEHIKEKQWERMFSRRLNSVVNMDPAYMAANDGSEQADGRGSGKIGIVDREAKQKVNLPGGRREVTPYMQMTFAALERRLDIAVFRALFASSARQAKQYITTGFVKVNGKTMTYPGYLLNPGDMFQVDIDKVLYAAGVRKSGKERRAERRRHKSRAAKADKAAAGAAEEEGAEEAAAVDETQQALAPEEQEAAAAEAEKSREKEAMAELQTLRAEVRSILAEPGELSAKRKIALRRLAKNIRRAMSRVRQTTADESDETIGDLVAQLDRLAVSPAQADDAGQPASEGVASLTKAERERFEQLVQEDEENPYDPSKPYSTPWRPRPYLSPFIFIPRYLEVNQNICAAVYLRHPVVRPGQSEVPSPFPPEIAQLAHNWYLRRR